MAFSLLISSRLSLNWSALSLSLLPTPSFTILNYVFPANNQCPSGLHLHRPWTCGGHLRSCRKDKKERNRRWSNRLPWLTNPQSQSHRFSHYLSAVSPQFKKNRFNVFEKFFLSLCVRYWNHSIIAGNDGGVCWIDLNPLSATLYPRGLGLHVLE